MNKIKILERLIRNVVTQELRNTTLHNFQQNSLFERIQMEKIVLTEAINPLAAELIKKHNGQTKTIGNDVYVWYKSPTGVHWNITVFSSRTSKLKNYVAKNEDQIMDFLKTKEKQFNDLSDWKAKNKQNANKEKEMMGHLVDVGDIFVSSWGYDQTNVDFYEVTKKISNNTIEVRKIAHKAVTEKEQYSTVVPIPGKFVGSANKVRINQYGVKVGRYQATPWDGKPKYETASGYGH